MSKQKKAISSHSYLAVTAVLAAIMMGVLDGTIMNVALPTLSHDFGVTPSNSIWMVNAYQLAVTPKSCDKVGRATFMIVPSNTPIIMAANTAVTAK